MKKGILLLVLIVFLFSSCIMLEEVPETTPTEMVKTQAATLQLLEETATSTIEAVESTATMTAIPTAVVTPTLTPTSLPSATPTQAPFAVQAATPLYMENFGYPDAGCNWMGVGGQIFDKNGAPLLNLVVWIRGTINGTPVEVIALTGTTEGAKYGPGGYEAILSNTALKSNGDLSIQVLDLNGDILTEPLPFDTSDQCDQNLIIINFSER